MEHPKISIIIPVFDALKYLPETLDSIRKQTFTDFEVICVDDDSTDGSADVLRRAAEEDTRFKVVHQPHAGAGAARNFGLTLVKGDYVIFSDSDDYYTPEMLEKLWQAASSQRADVVACNYSGLTPGGKVISQNGINTAWIPADKTVFSYRDCPDFIIRAAGPMVWNKMFRTDFIRARGLKFDELFTCNDLSFVAAGLAGAERVTCIPEPIVRYRFPRLNNPKNLRDVHAAAESALAQLVGLPHFGTVKKAVLRFLVDQYIGGLKKFVSDFSAEDSAWFYRKAHEVFNGSLFDSMDPRSLYNNDLYREYLTVRKHDYETMKLLASRRIIVSLTSFPKRVGTMIHTLETIYGQTRKADEIVLWLAEEQFPGREQDLPGELLQLIAENRLTLRWCEDLKGHKKYFYALQEYTEDVVVTIDDDLLYPKDMLDVLYKSYLLHPRAVSTLRAHLMMVSENGKVMPYKKWVHEVEACIHQPSMQLMTSGGAGDLYPPDIYRKEFFDRDVIMDICLWADNLWTKVMELASDVPVVLARKFEPLRCVDGSQEVTLYQVNGDQNQYDVQMEQISRWMDETFEPGILMNKLTSRDVGTKLWGVEPVAAILDEERKSNRVKRLRAEDRVEVLEAMQKELQARCRELESGLAQKEKELHLTAEQLAQTSEKLSAARNQVSRLEPLASIGGQYRDLGSALKKMKAEKGVTPSWCVKYALYVLAWLPAKFMSGVNGYIRNGLKHTIRSTMDRK